MIEDLILTDDGILYPVEFASHEIKLITIIQTKFQYTEKEAKKYLLDIYEKYKEEVLDIGIENRTMIPDAVAKELGYVFVFTGFMGFDMPIVIIGRPLNEKQLNALNKEAAIGNIDEKVYDYVIGHSKYREEEQNAKS